MLKKLLWIGIITIVMASATGCEQKTEQKYSSPFEKVNLAITKTGILGYIAEDKGYFEENGLYVKFQHYQSGKHAADILIADKTDIATSADFVLVSNSTKHKDLRVIGTITSANSIQLVARKDKGIEKIADLKGKRIGVKKKSTAEFFLGTFLLFNHISTDEVEIIDMSPLDMVENIAEGKIDAVIIWQPYAYFMKKRLGANAVSWAAQGGMDFYFLVLAKEKWINRNPGVVKRFMKALLDAEKFTKENNDEAKAIYTRITGYEYALVDQIWSHMNFTIELPQALLILLEDQTRWMIENKLTDTTEMPNYLNYMYFDTLKELKPEAITMIY